jgi:PPK2 family polyphosphate:nucleotide phosphotransferase
MTLCETQSRMVPQDTGTVRARRFYRSGTLIGESSVLKQFRIEPGVRVKLSDFDPSYSGNQESYERAVPEVLLQLQKMDRLQSLMYAERKHSLLIVLQGLDAGGKDGVIRHILSGLNVAGCRVVPFKQPTPQELGHDFLWRVHTHVPAKGEVAIFNRSHYEDVLVVRVHRLVPAYVWSKRYDLINAFERLLVTENHTTILKFFLHISKDEQLARFKRRLDDPARRWKISESDYLEREYWEDYVHAFEDMLRKTSTQHAPWFVVPSNHKWFRDQVITRIITGALEELNMELPESAVDIGRIRRRYHAAEAEAKGSPTAVINAESSCVSDEGRQRLDLPATSSSRQTTGCA